MKVAFVGPFALSPKGTVSGRTLPMAHALKERGYQVRVIVPPWDNPSFCGQHLEIEDVPVVNVPLPPKIPLWWYLGLTLRLLREIAAYQPEIVHIFKPKAFSGLTMMFLWVLRRFGLNKVRLVVDTDDWEGKGGWNEDPRYNTLQKVFFPIQERWTLRHADAVTVASRTLESMVTNLGVPPHRIFYVPNGLNSLPNGTGIVNVRQSYGLEGKPVILLYTRFFEFQVDRLVRIFLKVLSEAPDAHLLVIGKGFFGEEQELVKLASEAGILANLRYVGWVDPQQLTDYFASSDMAIYPLDDTLVNRTKCSLKLIELLAAGLPVVADRVGQNEEYIRSGLSGILIETGDDQAFAMQVASLLRDKERRRRLGEEAHSWVISQFKWETLVEAIEEAYSVAKYHSPYFNR